MVVPDLSSVAAADVAPRRGKKRGGFYSSAAASGADDGTNMAPPLQAVGPQPFGDSFCFSSAKQTDAGELLRRVRQVAAAPVPQQRNRLLGLFRSDPNQAEAEAVCSLTAVDRRRQIEEAICAAWASRTAILSKSSCEPATLVLTFRAAAGAQTASVQIRVPFVVVPHPAVAGHDAAVASAMAKQVLEELGCPVGASGVVGLLDVLRKVEQLSDDAASAMQPRSAAPSHLDLQRGGAGPTAAAGGATVNDASALAAIMEGLFNVHASHPDFSPTQLAATVEI
jgi:hypothetical protein